MHCQLESGHDLKAVGTLDESDDVLSDESFPGETLGVPAVCPGELEEDNVSNLMESSVMFLQVQPAVGLEVTSLKRTLTGRFGVLRLMAL